MNVERTVLNSEVYSNSKIEGTPFNIVETGANGWFITIGNERITEPTETKAEALEKLETEKWNIIVRMMGSMWGAWQTVINEEKKKEVKNA